MNKTMRTYGNGLPGSYLGAQGWIIAKKMVYLVGEKIGAYPYF
ncbi:hypothetical protein [Bacillus sp. ISL-18]|nr:hypothetical protein [Bacillus sp. ISL-18]